MKIYSIEAKTTNRGERMSEVQEIGMLLSSYARRDEGPMDVLTRLLLEREKFYSDNQRFRAALECIANHDFNGLGCGMGCMEEMVHRAKAALSEEK